MKITLKIFVPEYINWIILSLFGNHKSCSIYLHHGAQCRGTCELCSESLSHGERKSRANIVLSELLLLSQKKHKTSFFFGWAEPLNQQKIFVLGTPWFCEGLFLFQLASPEEPTQLSFWENQLSSGELRAAHCARAQTPRWSDVRNSEGPGPDPRCRRSFYIQRVSKKWPSCFGIERIWVFSSYQPFPCGWPLLLPKTSWTPNHLQVWGWLPNCRTALRRTNRQVYHVILSRRPFQGGKYLFRVKVLCSQSHASFPSNGELLAVQKYSQNSKTSYQKHTNTS